MIGEKASDVILEDARMPVNDSNEKESVTNMQ